MLFILLFIAELVLLFLLSKKLVDCLAGLIFRLTRSHKAVVSSLAILFLPGTIIHELAHLLSAGVMFVPVGEISIVPEIEEKGVRLGSVQIGRTDPFRRMIVGVAPVLFGLPIIASIFLIFKLGDGVTPFWQTVLAIYFIFVIGNTMFSSKKDIEGSILFVVLILVLLIVTLGSLYFLAPNALQNILTYISNINLDFASGFFKKAASFLIVPVILDLLIIILTLPFLKKHH